MYFSRKVPENTQLFYTLLEDFLLVIPIATATDVVVLEVISVWFNNIIPTTVPTTAAIPYATEKGNDHGNTAPPSVVLYTSIVPCPVPPEPPSIA